MRLLQAACVVAALSTEGCIIRRDDLLITSTDAGAPLEDAFLEDDAAPPPDDAYTPPDAPPDSPPDACTPSCVGGILNECMGEPRPCALGCHASGRCNEMILSNVDQTELIEQLRAATEPLEEIGERSVGDCAVPWMSGAGQRVCVYVYSRVDISGTVTFNGAYPVIVIARDFIRITGSIHAGARRGTPGPGAGGAGLGGDGVNEGAEDGGGGGGGSCGAGGSGGSGGSGGGSAGGAGGSASGAAVTMEPLMGGSRGGFGPGSGGGAGAGGGALQLSSWGTITISGGVYVGGGAGERGIASTLNFGSGGGGGGGGGLLIEAPVVDLAGASLLMSGGGGGGSSGLTGSGSDGGERMSFAGGNGGSGGLSARGGDGATERNGAAGGNNGEILGNGGGGGGGVGTFVIRRASGSDAASLSPSASSPCFASLPLRMR